MWESSQTAHPEEGLSKRSASKARLEGPIIVLVRPQLGQNIGKAARAMLNFGLTEMRLVAPRDGWPNPEAGPSASGADVVLEQAKPLRHNERSHRRLLARLRVHRSPARPCDAGRHSEAMADQIMPPPGAPPSCSDRSERGLRRRTSHWPPRSSPFPSIRSSARSTSLRRSSCSHMNGRGKPHWRSRRRRKPSRPHPMANWTVSSII